MEGTGQRFCLYAPSWQKLRVSLIAENNNYGGFGTLEGVKKNVDILRRYMLSACVIHDDDGPMLDHESRELLYRGWRVLNLCNAVLLGYGARPDYIYHKDLIVDLRAEAQAFYRMCSSCGASFESPDWERLESDYRNLYENDVMSFVHIYKNLKHRENTANRKEANGTGGMRFRCELARVLDVMERLKAIA